MTGLDRVLILGLMVFSVLVIIAWFYVELRTYRYLKSQVKRKCKICKGLIEDCHCVE